MGSKFSDLVDYFKQLAREHVDIKHTDKNKHFYRFEIEEVITALCTNINYPALILEGYDFDYGDSSSDNITKRRTGSFILIDRVPDAGNFDKIHEVWDKMERIGEDILIRMREDKASGQVKCLRGFDISESNGIPLKIEELGQYGIRFSFAMVSPVDCEIDTAKWMS